MSASQMDTAELRAFGPGWRFRAPSAPAFYSSKSICCRVASSFMSLTLSLSLPLSLSRFSWTIILSATICEGCSATEKAQSASLRMCRKEVVFLLRSCHLNPSEATSVLSSAEHAMPCLPNCSGAIFREPIWRRYDLQLTSSAQLSQPLGSISPCFQIWSWHGNWRLQAAFLWFSMM